MGIRAGLAMLSVLGLTAGLTVALTVPASAGPALRSQPAAAMAPAVQSTDAASETSVGTDFWLAFPTNAAEIDVPQLTLSISGSTAGTGTISAPAPGQSGSQTFTITPGQVTQVAIDASVVAIATDGLENKGIHVTASVPVSVYGTNHIDATTSGWLGLPTSSLGRSYRVLGYTTSIGGAGWSSQLTVVGTVDGTTLTITPATAIDGHPAGVVFTQMIDRGQTYQLQATTLGQDVSGTSVSATAPVMVMGGNGCGNVPASGSACDSLEQTMLPVSTWGTHFAAVRYATRTKGDTYRVLANEDGTVVSVNGAVAATIDAGQFYEAVLPANADSAGNDGVQIDASKPVTVAQYGNGTSFDSTTGDPLMLVVPPTGEFLDSYTISAPDISSSDVSFTPYASVVVPTGDAGQVSIDGTAIPAGSFATIGTSGYSGAQLTLTTGTHTFGGPHPFGLQIYEWGAYDGFGYPGGTSLVRISGPAESPGAPNSATAAPGNQSAAVTWTAPADDGGSAVTSYAVQGYLAGERAPGKTCTLTSPFTPPLQCTVTGLTNGTGYTFTVTAANAIGSGPESAASAAVTPENTTPVAPDAPTAVTAAAGDAQAAVTWTAPVGTGGATVTSYTVQALVNGNPVAAKTCTLTGPFTPPLQCTVEGLTNGTSYTFTVVATNSAGTSIASGASNAVVPAPAPTAPGAPTDVTAVAGNQQVGVGWTAPLDDGDSAVTSYTAQAFVNGVAVAGKTCTLTGSITPPLTCTIAGLNNGTTYTVAVTATNAIGTGPASDPSTSVTPTPPPTEPGVPTSVTGTAGNGQASVSWTAPDSDGGAPIGSYTVQAYLGNTAVGGATCTVTAPFTPPLKCTVDGLTNGSAYTFAVTATNTAGTSAASDRSAPVTPAPAQTAPGSPVNVGTTAADSQIAVSWTAPEADGGAPITSYTVQALRNGVVVPDRTCTISSPFPGGLTCTVSGLTNGTAYTFEVTATNSVGAGSPSLPSDQVAPIPDATVPAAPTGVTAAAGNGAVTVSWQAPASNGGSPVGFYLVQAYVGGVAVSGATCETTVVNTHPHDALSCTVTGLTNGTSYTFKVSATNSVGTGPASAASAGATPTTGAVLAVLPTTVAGGRVGVKYSGQVTATAGTLPISYVRIADGSPPGMTLNHSTGALGGTPTQAGTFTLVIRATNSAGSATRSYRIVIAAALKPPVLPTTVAGGRVGVKYSGQVTATSGTLPISYVRIADGSPPGMTLNHSTGALGGTPTQAGTFTLVIRATNTDGSATRSYRIVIGAALKAPVLPTTVAGGRVGVKYSGKVTATAGTLPISYVRIADGSPPGMTLNHSTGALGGTPVQAGTFTLVIRATNADGSATRSYRIVIAAAAARMSRTLIPG